MAILGMPDELESFEETTFVAYMNSDTMRFRGRSMQITLTILPEHVKEALVLHTLGGQSIPLRVTLALYEGLFEDA